MCVPPQNTYVFCISSLPPQPLSSASADTSSNSTSSSWRDAQLMSSSSGSPDNQVLPSFAAAPLPPQALATPVCRPRAHRARPGSVHLLGESLGAASPSLAGPTTSLGSGDGRTISQEQAGQATAAGGAASSGDSRPELSRHHLSSTFVPSAHSAFAPPRRCTAA